MYNMDSVDSSRIDLTHVSFISTTKDVLLIKFLAHFSFHGLMDPLTHDLMTTIF